MKKASIVICVYNMRDYIAKAVLSAAEQTYPEVEVLVIDDGSSDGTGELLDQLAAEHARVRVIHQENRGVTAARAVGLAEVSGDYITWLDGDDWLEKTMLETLITAMETHDAQMALCNYENISAATGRHLKRYPLDGDIVLDGGTALKMLMTKEISQSLCANVACRELYRYVEFRPGTLYEDVDNTYKLYMHAERVVMVDQLLFGRLIRRDSICHAHVLSGRVESCECYLNRQEILRREHPELDVPFYSGSYPMLLPLRRAVFHDSYANFRKYRKRIRAVCRDFRSHMADALSGESPDFWEKLEYRLLTSGTYAGFYLSRVLGIGKKGGSRLKLVE